MRYIIRKLYEEERIIFWLLALMLLIEIIVLFSLIYFSRFERFFFLFVNGIRLTSPVFLVFNLVFLIYTLFTKGAELTIKSWKIYLLKSLKYFITSLLITISAITVSAFLGALAGIVLKRLYYLPSGKGILDPLRKWVSENFY